MKTYEVKISTRHQGLVDWLARRGIRGQGLAYPTREDVLGHVIVGTLPYHLAEAAAAVVSVELTLSTEMLDRELTCTDVAAANPKATAYVVTKIRSRIRPTCKTGSWGLWTARELVAKINSK